jgi:hypothetical protein
MSLLTLLRSTPPTAGTQLHYGVGGAWKQLTLYYGDGGVWKQLTLYYGDGGVWK